MSKQVSDVSLSSLTQSAVTETPACRNPRFMETRNIVLDPGQSRNIQFQDNHQPSNFVVPYPEAFRNVSVTHRDEQHSSLYDEPIDLSRKDGFIDAYYSRFCVKNEEPSKEDQAANILQHQASQICLDFEKKRRRKNNTLSIYGTSIIIDENQPASFSPEKQAEILKAACSLFSKRTRTLYQWMYPNVPKQQVKIAVANCWQSLGQSEKDFYVSQVLGRFGFHTTNLMVNPQLHTIKELPPELPKPPPVIQPRRNTGELQKAISSISVPQHNKPMLGLNGCGTVKVPMKRRKTALRGGSSKRKFIISANSEDFQDDPELSQELEKFAVKFNLSNIQ
ncbi:unnamed protein product [Callosobruchus maculatus]|uniref:Uncharacterized protein n=1 Tax=Callosobruchus maculatus TaxID=64391 RepID=A0A653BFV3_CALMS|nr:unnamed protein product [Callosobruchus maculatus]